MPKLGMRKETTTMSTMRLMLPATEAAAYLGVTLSTLRRETRRGKLRAKRIGARYWYNRAMLEHYAAEMDGVDGEHPGPQAKER